MSKIRMDGNTRVTFVPTIADISAPTVTELTAQGAVDLSCILTPDGLDISYDEATVDTSTLCSRQDSKQAGRTSASITLTYFRDDDEDKNEAETTLVQYTEGFLVVRPSIDHEAAYAAEQKVRVYTVQCGEQRDVKFAANMQEQIQQTLFNSGDYERNAVVAAGS